LPISSRIDAPLSEFFEQRRRSLDIREKQGLGAAWELRHRHMVLGQTDRRIRERTFGSLKGCRLHQACLSNARPPA
jgi:hypothetical protein